MRHFPDMSVFGKYVNAGKNIYNFFAHVWQPSPPFAIKMFYHSPSSSSSVAAQPCFLSKRRKEEVKKCEGDLFFQKGGRKLSKIITVWRQGNWDWENIIRMLKLKVSAYIDRFQILLWEWVSQNCSFLRMKNMPFPYFHFSRVQCRLRRNWYKGNCFNATWAKPSTKRFFSTKSLKKPSVLFDVYYFLNESVILSYFMNKRVSM